MQNKLVVTTFASNPQHPGFLRLAATVKAWGWNWMPMFGEWRGDFSDKFRAVVRNEPMFRSMGYTHILFTDAYDTACVGPPEAIERFIAANKMGVSCEKACWPDESLKDRYPQTTSEWKYVNSGQYFGPIDLVMKVLEGATGDDQLWLTHKYFADPHNIELDDKCEAFQSLAHCIHQNVPWTETFRKLPNGRLFNRKTGTQPLFVHANGGPGTPMDWLEPLRR